MGIDAAGRPATTTVSITPAALVEAVQAAGAYTGTLSLHIDFDYMTGSFLASSRDQRRAWSDQA